MKTSRRAHAANQLVIGGSETFFFRYCPVYRVLFTLRLLAKEILLSIFAIMFFHIHSFFDDDYLDHKKTIRPTLPPPTFHVSNAHDITINILFGDRGDLAHFSPLFPFSTCSSPTFSNQNHYFRVSSHAPPPTCHHNSLFI